VTAAANEAGGQGFVTEIAGQAETYAEVILPSWERSDMDVLAQHQGSIIGLLEQSSAFATFDGYVDAVRETVELREGFGAQSFADCVYCYTQAMADDDPALSTDRQEFLEALDEYVFEPLRLTADLFKAQPFVTRMYTTLSASEMTLDPTFDFNDVLGEYSNLHVANRTLHCANPGGDWELTLPDGTKILGTGQDWPIAAQPANARILQLAVQGEGTVIRNNAEEIGRLTEESNSRYPGLESDGACACSTPGAPGGGHVGALGLLMAAGFVARRRRLS
jgi:MYXO-CTERM domain-containing protein